MQQCCKATKNAADINKNVFICLDRSPMTCAVIHDLLKYCMTIIIRERLPENIDKHSEGFIIVFGDWLLSQSLSFSCQ